MHPSFTQVSLLALAALMHRRRCKRLLHPMLAGVFAATHVVLWCERARLRTFCRQRRVHVAKFLLLHALVHVAPFAVVERPRVKKDRVTGAALALGALFLWWPKIGEWPEHVYTTLPDRTWRAGLLAYVAGATLTP